MMAFTHGFVDEATSAVWVQYNEMATVYSVQYTLYVRGTVPVSDGLEIFVNSKIRNLTSHFRSCYVEIRRG